MDTDHGQSRRWGGAGAPCEARLARETGLSRAEVLRRGLKSFAGDHGASPMLEFMASLEDAADAPPDMAARHDDYLAEAYVDRHDRSK